MGVNQNRVIMLVFVLGGAMAGVAALLYTIQYDITKFDIGFIIGLKAFTAAVLGGIGNLRGALVGGLLLGIAVFIATLLALYGGYVIDRLEKRRLLILAMLSSHASTEPPQEAGGLYVGGFEDHYVRTPGGWRFKSRYGRVVLHQGGAMPNIPAPSPEARGLK